MKNLILKLEKEHPRLLEILRFLLIGGFATLIDMCVMALIIYLPNAPLFDNKLYNVFLYKNAVSGLVVAAANACGFLSGLLFNYVFSVIFVYKGDNSSAKTGRGFLGFAALSLAGLTIQTAGVYVGYELLNINEWIVKIIFVFIVLVFNYYTRKKFIFNGKAKAGADDDGEDKSCAVKESKAEMGAANNGAADKTDTDTNCADKNY